MLNINSAWQTEYPTWPRDSVPGIPMGFEDNSWRGNGGPSLINHRLGLLVFVDHPDPAHRQGLGVARFGLWRTYQGGELDDAPFFESDDWDAVLREIAVERLAAAFWDEIRRAFTKPEIAKIRRRNRAYDAAGSDACATHDFCDANEIMLAAFQREFCRQPLFLDDVGEDAAHPDFDLWNRAWERTRTAHLI